METVESIVRTTMEEIEKLLTTRSVVGEPIMIDGKTLIPLVSIGFAFGAGAGSGKSSMRQQQEGTGGGTGGGGGVKPIAVIVSDQDGIRIESIRGGLASAMEKMVEKAIPMMQRRKQEQAEQKEEPSQAP